MSKAFEIISKFEGLRLNPYLCSAGVPTIGWGQTKGITLQTKPWTKEQADCDLETTIKEIEEQTKKIVKVPLTENQLAALTSFVYNLGLGAFKKSTLLKKINLSDFKGASLELLKWNKAGGRILKGLTNRRKAEMDLFLTTDTPLTGKASKTSKR